MLYPTPPPADPWAGLTAEQIAEQLTKEFLTAIRDIATRAPAQPPISPFPSVSGQML